MTTVVGMFDTRAEAEAAVERLVHMGVDRDRISVALREPREKADFADRAGAHGLSGVGTAAGLASGAGVGVLVGLAVAGGSMVMPGIGTFVVGGPIASALAGAGVGAVSGGLVGGLVGAGLPASEAEHFSAGMERGLVLVAAQVGYQDAAESRRILDEEGSLRTYCR